MAMGRGALARNTQLKGRRLDTRVKLVDAGRQMFHRLGYDATTVADIVAAAGVSRATFYLYFTGKQELYQAIGAEFVDELTDRFRLLDGVVATGTRSDLREKYR